MITILNVLLSEKKHVKITEACSPAINLESYYSISQRFIAF